MTIKQALEWAIKKLPLKNSSILDAEIILSWVLKKPKIFILAHPETKLTPHQFKKFKTAINERKKHKPIAYILGEKEFYNLKFFVNKNVLIPRPETELLIEEALKMVRTLKNRPAAIIDVGTGSGCIIISLAKSLLVHPSLRSSVKFFATDIAPVVLKIARKNARYHGIEKHITFLRGNLLEPISKIRNFANLQIGNLVIVANLPYLPLARWDKTQPEIKKYEPKTALNGGKDGLDYYRRLFQQIEKLFSLGFKQISCFIEIDPCQVKKIKKIASPIFSKIEIKKDLNGLSRIVCLYS